MSTMDSTPYDSAWAIAGKTGSHGSHIASEFDQKRITSYDLYDAIYRNVTGVFKLTARGSEDDPIYIPSGTTIIEACNRFLGVDLDFAMDGVSEEDEQDIARVLDRWLRRQRFWSKYATQKRYGLVRGDTMWHVLVTHPDHRDPLRRVRLLELDPRTAFAITSIDDVDETVGWIIIQTMADPAQSGKSEIVKRIKYTYTDDGRVRSEMDYYPINAWDDRLDPSNLEPYHQNVRPLPQNSRRGSEPWDVILPDSIDHLPIYHIRNKRAPLDPYGVSELAGIERIIAAVNQAVTDEEMALALEGLGLYATTSGPPVDDNGNPVNWILGPGRVVEISPDSSFVRVPGITSIQPNQEHIKTLDSFMRQASGTSDTAVGQVNVQVAQSGIALALQMAPLLSKNKEKETEMADEYASLFTDVLTKWMPEYDVIPFYSGLDVIPVFGDPMPVDRAGTVAEVAALLNAKVITVAEAQRILHEKIPELTFDLSSSEDLADDAARFAAAADPFGMRMLSEMQ